MGLGKYRAYKDAFQDDGLEKLFVLGENFTPDFYNRNTIQVWDVSSIAKTTVSKWKGVTLTDRTLHEITIVNNSNSEKLITFASSYLLPDADVIENLVVTIGPQGTAHFYATAVLNEGNLFFTLRRGSQDDRKL
mgnify:CR=1